MAKIYKSASELVGKTPLLEVEKYENSEVLTEFAAWLYARKK